MLMSMTVPVPNGMHIYTYLSSMKIIQIWPLTNDEESRNCNCNFGDVLTSVWQQGKWVALCDPNPPNRCDIYGVQGECAAGEHE